MASLQIRGSLADGSLVGGFEIRPGEIVEKLFVESFQGTDWNAPLTRVDLALDTDDGHRVVISIPVPGREIRATVRPLE